MHLSLSALYLSSFLTIGKLCYSQWRLSRGMWELEHAPLHQVDKMPNMHIGATFDVYETRVASCGSLYRPEHFYTVTRSDATRQDVASRVAPSSSFIVDHPRSGVVYIILVVSVCLSICMSVCMCIRRYVFESLDVRSSYLHIRCISTVYESTSYMKVIGSRSKSQKQKRSKIPIPAM